MLQSAGMKLHETEESCFDSRQEQEIFLLPKASKKAVGPTHPPNQRALGTIS
jgi:hypothetical protein